MLKKELGEVSRMLERKEEKNSKGKKEWSEPQLIKSDEPLERVTMNFYPPPPPPG